MIGANGSVRGKKEFEPSSLAAESEPLLGPHLEDYWPMEVAFPRMRLIVVLVNLKVANNTN